MQKAGARLLIVEDDSSIVRGLTDVFLYHGYRPTGIEDGGEGLAEALEGNYDLILLDVMLPTRDGFSICREVRKHKPGQAIIMMTAKGSEDDIVTGFTAGADDYVCKPFSIRELLVRVEAVLRRTGKAASDIQVRFGDVVFDGKTLTAACGQRTVKLTRREFDMVVYLQRHGDRIVSKKELLKEVWNYNDTDIETRTVDIHVLKLRKKIADLYPGPFIQTVRGEGYRLEPQP